MESVLANKDLVNKICDFLVDPRALHIVCGFIAHCSDARAHQLLYDLRIKQYKPMELNYMKKIVQKFGASDRKYYKKLLDMHLPPPNFGITETCPFYYYHPRAKVPNNVYWDMHYTAFSYCIRILSFEQALREYYNST